MKNKSDVFGKFKEYEATVNAIFGTKISRLRADQGTEYSSKEQMEYYKVRGIQLEQTVRYTPQQNGVAERFNRKVVEKTRSMLLQAKMPKYMRGGERLFLSRHI